MNATFCDAIRPPVKVTLSGSGSVLVENHTGISKFCDTAITLRTSDGALTVSGTSLKILFAAENELAVEGKISSISYV